THVGVADDREILPPCLERRERAVADELELTADFLRRPQVLARAPRVAAGSAVHRFDCNESAHIARGGAGARPSESAQRRNHRVEVRKCDSSPGTTEERAARDVLTSQELHVFRSLWARGCRYLLSNADATGSALLLRNALLRTTADTTDAIL